MNEDKYLRQKEILPKSIYRSPVTIIGVGSVGRQIALQLTTMGVKQITLIDFDRVELHNLPNQGYKHSDIGRFKVYITAEDCARINRDVSIHSINDKYNQTWINTNYVFLCVDDIEVRAKIVNECNHVKYFIDTRMAAEIARILTVYDEESKDYYLSKTLFKKVETFNGTCTRQSTIYCANLIASLAVAQWTKLLRNAPIDNDFTYDILGNDLIIERTNGKQ